MSDAAIFVAIAGALFVLRFIVATAIFFWLLPNGDRCPNCDAPTLWVRAPIWNRLAPWLRTSWCPGCGWEGMLRHGPLTPTSEPATRRGSRAVNRRPAPGTPDVRRRETAD